MDASAGTLSLATALGGACTLGEGARVCVDPVVPLLAHAALALLFAQAGWHKLRDLGGFEAVFDAYEIVPRAWAPLAAHGLVLVEIGVALGLAWGALPVPGAAIASLCAGVGTVAAMTVYAVAIAINLARGRAEIDCGCMGPAGRPQHIAPWLIARNAVVALGALPILTLGLGAAAERACPLHWIDGLTLLGAVAALALAWSAVHGIAAVAMPRFTSVAGEGRAS